ncbi:MAG: cytochrome c3 family protein [Proteobacteria bacterium]|nr:cytochrome c3 family protein [Pseudomonadota bacterium]
MSVKMCPEHISFDEIENLFEPVGFSHKSHAEMSEMNGGCTTCHHKTPTDQDHPSCKECHHPRTDIEDLEKPGLKAAYHRACKKCHAGWSEHAECEVCHNSKSEKEANTVGERKSEPRSVVVPHKLIYEKRLQKGPYVTFFHEKHIKTHEIECEDCHGNQSCQACHYQTEKPSSHRIRTRAEKHIRCSDCHDTEERTECLNCHSKSY